MARHPWVAAADDGIRWGVQLVLGDEGLPRLLETGRNVEALGFDGCYIFDHPAVQADPWVCLSALTGVTERVRLGSFVNCIPYRHPAMVARMTADLDNISHGRFLLGLGIGWLKPEFEAFGVSFDPIPERFAALEEALEIIPGVWGPEKFAYEGQYYQIGPLQVSPRPVQQPRPPLVIGGSGKRSLRLVAQYADACNVNDVAHTERGLERVGGPEFIAHNSLSYVNIARSLAVPTTRSCARTLRFALFSGRTMRRWRRRSPTRGRRRQDRRVPAAPNPAPS